MIDDSSQLIAITTVSELEREQYDINAYYNNLIIDIDKLPANGILINDTPNFSYHAIKFKQNNTILTMSGTDNLTKKFVTIPFGKYNDRRYFNMMNGYYQVALSGVIVDKLIE